MNVADFIDENILEKLAKLEELERAELEAEGLGDTDQTLADWKETEKEIENMHSTLFWKNFFCISLLNLQCPKKDTHFTPRIFTRPH